jgi:hypothetical protein
VVVVVLIVFCGTYQKSDFYPGGAGESLSSKEEYFDCSCFWPPGIGAASDPHLSTCPGVADFFLECNALRFEREEWPSAEVLEDAEVSQNGLHFLNI